MTFKARAKTRGHHSRKPWLKNAEEAMLLSVGGFFFYISTFHMHKRWQWGEGTNAMFKVSTSAMNWRLPDSVVVFPTRKESKQSSSRLGAILTVRLALAQGQLSVLNLSSNTPECTVSQRTKNRGGWSVRGIRWLRGSVAEKHRGNTSWSITCFLRCHGPNTQPCSQSSRSLPR